MFIVETLPRAGTPLFYQRNAGKWHKAVIDTGMLFSWCGTLNYKKVNPNKDNFTLREPLGHFCSKCWR